MLPGGTCIHTGTIPSKSLRKTIIDLLAIRRSGELGVHATFSHTLSMRHLMHRTDSVIHNQVRTLQNFFERNQVAVHAGNAAFISPTEIRVATPHGVSTIRSEKIFIATGSRPRRPDDLPFDDRAVFDSDTILSMNNIPRSMTVLGGGVIGCEYASMFAALGVRITLLDRRSRMLTFLDTSILDQLYHHMRAMGIRIMPEETVQQVQVVDGPHGSTTKIELASGRTVNSEKLLVTAGRESNTFSLDLSKVGIESDDTGLIKVNEHYQTSQSGIYAIGDVIGFPALAGTSMHQGRVAALHAAGRETPEPHDLPIAIYTIPEISMVGKTEQDCRREKIVYEIGVARYSESARGQINGDLEGVLKLVFRREDRVLLGVHLIGQGSSELVHIGMSVVHSGGTVDQLANSVFNYPTISESYRVAALDGLNRL